jgi:hypothetical protein
MQVPGQSAQRKFKKFLKATEPYQDFSNNYSDLFFCRRPGFSEIFLNNQPYQPI